jgi:hypothetical protein
MRLRLMIALASLFGFSLSAQAEPPKPTLIVAAKPVTRLVSDYREMVRLVGDEAAVKEFENELKGLVGEQGFDGIDLNRSLAAYATVTEKIEQSSLVVVIPVTGEKNFLALLDRMKAKPEAVKDKKGLYKLELPLPLPIPVPSVVQFVEGGWAYVGINTEDVADANKRLPAAQLVDEADQSLFSVKLFPGRFPEKVLKSWLDAVDMQAAALKGFIGAGGPPPHVTKMITTFLEEGPKLLHRYGETGLKEALEVGVQFRFDVATGDTVTELTLVPKPGSQLAKEIAAKGAVTSRFAGLIPKTAAVSAVTKVPVFARELQDIVSAIVGALEGELKDLHLPEPFRPVVEELAKGVTEGIKKGNLDVATALVGPDKDGKFTWLAAVTLADTAALEKTVREAAKSPEYAKDFEFDVAKDNGVAIHKVPLSKVLPEDFLREFVPLLGEKPLSYVAFTKDAAFLTFGTDALAQIKAAVQVKPSAGPVLEIGSNMHRLHKMIHQLNEQAAGAFAKHMGTEDKPVTMLRVTEEGGKTLKVKAVLNVRYIPKFFTIESSVL